MNKPLRYIVFFAIFICSCSYLPTDITLDESIDYEETTEYIKLSVDSNPGDKAFLFLPGGLVDPHAYMKIMEQVVAQGYNVFILKFTANLGIMEINKPLKFVKQKSGISHWYIGGHSLGGITAQAAVEKESNTFKGLVFLGVYPSENYLLSAWDKNVLSIYAEYDQLSTMDKIESTKSYLPPELEVEELDGIESQSLAEAFTWYYFIEGGNHAQFGSYGSQDGDGVASISEEQQQELTAKAITQFIDWNENN